MGNPTRTWNTGTFYFPIDLDGFGVLPILDLDFNTSQLYASSLYGKIFYSLNNGQSWTEQTTPVSDPIHSISFRTNNKGIAIAGNKVLYTSNGGVVGVSEINNLASFVSVYPNPTNGILKIETEFNIKINSLYITDFSGKRIKEFNKTQADLNIRELPNGIYFLNIQTNSKTFTHKIIKQ